MNGLFAGVDGGGSNTHVGDARWAARAEVPARPPAGPAADDDRARATVVAERVIPERGAVRCAMRDVGVRVRTDAEGHEADWRLC